jgi:hypothetical protein
LIKYRCTLQDSGMPYSPCNNAGFDIFQAFLNDVKFGLERRHLILQHLLFRI